MTSSTPNEPSKLISSLRKSEKNLGGIIYDDFVAFKELNDYDDRLEINEFTIEVVVRSFVDDLEKYSQYHNNIDPDRYKQAAYLMYCISKFKPIPLSLGETNRCRHPLLHTSKYGLVNEVFALQVGLARLKIDFLRLSPGSYKITKELIYQLYFRDVNPKQLYITLELFHKNIVLDFDTTDFRNTDPSNFY